MRMMAALAALLAGCVSMPPESSFASPDVGSIDAGTPDTGAIDFAYDATGQDASGDGQADAESQATDSTKFDANPECVRSLDCGNDCKSFCSNGKCVPVAYDMQGKGCLSLVEGLACEGTCHTGTCVLTTPNVCK